MFIEISPINPANKWLCHQCSISIPSRYNPFNVLNYDKYDNNQLDHNEIADNISGILDTCKMFNIDSYKTHVSEMKYTISEDGNSSNFDSLAVDLSQYSEQFSILAVAETNVNEADKNLYPINGYILEYNSKIFRNVHP